ncbi:MAG: sugar phosphate isomerase/epimerase [Clostridia bacterium]|nr:sugar phosphate isomerase/epimerase [Clostridia bacterium]
MLGITAVNGYPIPLEFRFPLLKKAGFDSIILGWDNSEMATRVDRVWLAKAFDLKIEHAHASYANMNTLWLPGNEGNRTALRLLREIADAAEFGIETLVLHLTNGSTPPPVSTEGLNRIEYLVRLAEDSGIKLAFENVRVPQHTQAVLDEFTAPHVGLGFDAGHAHLWAPEMDWLTLYKDRVFAIHLHDNMGDDDTHQLPMDGGINWIDTMKKLAASSYTGSITLESDFRSCKVYEQAGLEEYLRTAYNRASALETILQKYREK